MLKIYSGHLSLKITNHVCLKFIEILMPYFFRELFKCPGGAQLARDTFEQNKSFYHSIAATMIAKDLGHVV